jgi:Plasmid encoded RepA protein
LPNFNPQLLRSLQSDDVDTAGPFPTQRSPSLFGSPESVQSILPRIGLTKRKLRTLETIQIVREEREQRKQQLAFNARPFVLCGIPLRRPNRNQLAYTRRNGHFSLSIVAHPEYGVPYGQDRLIPIWVATLALRQKSRAIRFRYLTEFLHYFGLPTTGPYYKRTAAAFQRVFGATIFFGTEDRRQPQAILDWTRFHFFDQIKLWFNREAGKSSQPHTECANVITLSEAFFSEIQNHPIPLERRVVAALSNSPGALDLYAWLSWKAWRVTNSPVHVPLFGPQGLAQQLGTVNYARARAFREKIETWLIQVQVWWPVCPAFISANGRFLTIRPQRTLLAVRPVEDPVNSSPR